MRKSLKYLWLFLALWVAITVVVWMTSDWKAYYDRGNGPEVKIYLARDEQLIVSAVGGLIGASAITILARLTDLWLTSRRIPMG